MIAKMANNKNQKCYVGTVLFDEDEFVSDFSSSSSFRERLPRPRPNATGNNITGNQQQQKIRQVKQNIVNSATRSLNLLIDTEDIGIQATNELVEQGGQLHNINNKLDEINDNLAKSKKNLNGIKSVFGNIKNYVKGKDKSRSREASPNPHSNKKLAKSGASRFNTLIAPQNTISINNPHPSSLLRGTDIQTSCGSDTSQDIDKKLDEIVTGMMQHVNTLKEIGRKQGNEIDHQNELIDTIDSKVQATEAKIVHQNRAMNKILRK